MRTTVAAALFLALAACSPPPPPPVYGIEGDWPTPTPAALPTLDLFGDPLPPGALARAGTLRLRHSHARRAAFAPDGAALATVGWRGDRGTVELWDASAGRPLRTFEAGPAPLRSVAFSGDGRRLAAGDDEGALWIWNVDSAELLRNVQAHAHPVLAVALSPDGSLAVSGSEDGRALVWNLARDLPPTPLAGPYTDIRLAAFLADGRDILLVEADGVARAFDRAGEPGLKFYVIESSAACAALSPDGTRVAAASHDGTLAIRDLDTARRRWKIQDPGRSFDDLAFAAGRLAAIRDQGFLVLFDADTGSLDARADAAPHRPGSLAVAPDGRRLAAVGWHGATRLWTLPELRPDSPAEAHLETVHAVALSPDGSKLLTLSSDRTLRVWDAATGAPIRTLAREEGFGSAAFGAGGRTILAAGTDSLLRAYPLDRDAEPFLVPGPAESLLMMALSADRSLAAVAASSGPIRVIDVETGAERGRHEPRATHLHAIALSPDGGLLAALAWTDRPPAEPRRALAVISLRTGRELFRRDSTGVEPRPIAFLPEGRGLVGATDNRAVAVWSLADGRVLRSFSTAPEAVEALAVSPDGRRIACASSANRIYVWDLAAGARVARLEGHRGRVAALAFSSDGALLVSGGADTTALVWRLPPPQAESPTR